MVASCVHRSGGARRVLCAAERQAVQLERAAVVPQHPHGTAAGLQRRRSTIANSVATIIAIALLSQVLIAIAPLMTTKRRLSISGRCKPEEIPVDMDAEDTIADVQLLG